MITLEIRGARSVGKMAEIAPMLGKLHQFGTYWRDGALCVDYRRREDADLVMVQLNTLPGVHAEIVQGPCP